MGIFNKFRETIFLKLDNNLENCLTTLKSNREFAIDKEQIDKDIRCLELGLKGENEIIYELKHSNIDMYVLHDVNIQSQDETAQIDYVIITSAHCYLIECKFFLGNIIVEDNGEFRREYHNKKFAIYSPYRQAVRHKELLKKIWLNKKSKLTKFFYEKTFDEYYKPLVVFANSDSMITFKSKSKELQNSVIRVDQLVEYLKKDINQKKEDILDSKKTMETLAKKFLSIHINVEKDYMSKYDYFKEENTEYFREKLLEFRKNKSKEKNLPAYYIFSNKELEDILRYLPKNKEELKNLNILDEMKIKYHGNEIIRIINEDI